MNHNIFFLFFGSRLPAQRAHRASGKDGRRGVPSGGGQFGTAAARLSAGRLQHGPRSGGQTGGLKEANHEQYKLFRVRPLLCVAIGIFVRGGSLARHATRQRG